MSYSEEIAQKMRGNNLANVRQDPYWGTYAYLRLIDGTLRPGPWRLVQQGFVHTETGNYVPSTAVVHAERDNHAPICAACGLPVPGRADE